METNAYKNDKIEKCRIEMDEVHVKIGGFEQDIVLLKDYNHRLLKLEDHIDKRILQIRKEIGPVTQRSQSVANDMNNVLN